MHHHAVPVDSAEIQTTQQQWRRRSDSGGERRKQGKIYNDVLSAVFHAQSEAMKRTRFSRRSAQKPAK